MIEGVEIDKDAYRLSLSTQISRFIDNHTILLVIVALFAILFVILLQFINATAALPIAVFATLAIVVAFVIYYIRNYKYSI